MGVGLRQRKIKRYKCVTAGGVCHPCTKAGLLFRGSFDRTTNSCYGTLQTAEKHGVQLFLRQILMPQTSAGFIESAGFCKLVP